MPSAFPGQIPPDRRYTDHDKSAQIPATAQASSSSMQNMWPSVSVSSPDSNPGEHQELRSQQTSSSLTVRPLPDLTSNACRIVEAATSTWRYSPYEHRSIVHSPSGGPPEKSFIKAERMSPKLTTAPSVSLFDI